MAEASQTRQFSCHQCRARNLKCNRLWPCQRCSQLGEDCQFPEARQRPGQAARMPKVKELEGRLVDLEHRFQQQQRAEVEQHAGPPGGIPHDAREHAQVMPTGRLEQLPPQPVVDELTSIYFSRLYPEAPMQHPARYLDSLRRPPHMQPPFCLQYAILAMAAGLSPAHKPLAQPFYYRARTYIEHDEMRGRILCTRTIQADGHRILTLGHAQCWLLLAQFEAQRLWHPRAALSVSRCVRLAQMLGLYDVEAAHASFALAPAGDWREKEERRRTMWAIFCMDRLSSSTTGWHPLVDVRRVRTLLPASEEAFQRGIEEPSLTLHDALGGASARLSPFACRVLAAHLFYACLEHSFTGYPGDDGAASPESSEFWKRQENLDNRLSALFVVLPDSVRCPEGLARHDAVLINLNLHTASICIHRVALVRAKAAPADSGRSRGPAARLLASARAIFAILNGLGDPRALFANPFVGFAAFVAALVFLDDFASTHDRESEGCFGALMDLIVAMANDNLVAASLALQLAEHLKKSGIDPSAVAKVRHLAAKVETDCFLMGLHNDHTGAVLSCPFQPKPQVEA